MVLIHHQHRHPRQRVTSCSEDEREDGEERHGQNEAERARAAVTAQCRQGCAYDGHDHSRNSLPVRCRKTDSRLGLRSVTSASSCPALAAESSKPLISDACPMLKCATPFSMDPPSCFTHAATASFDFSKSEERRV